MKTKTIDGSMLFLRVSLALLLMCPAAGFADIPQEVNYQGYLTDPEGAVDNPALLMKFSLYDALTAGVELWSEIQTVEVKAGVYSVILGSSTPFPASLSFNNRYYLEVAIDGDNSGTVDSGEELAPRLPLTSVPYAVSADSSQYALNADTVDGRHAGELQDRVSGLCGVGSSIRIVHEDGSVDCEPDSGITVETDPTVNALAKAKLICISGQVAKFNAMMDTWTCSNDSDTIYEAGTGLDLTDSTFSIEVPLALTSAMPGPAIKGTNSGAGSGVLGLHSGSGNYGYLGSSLYGIYGEGSSGYAGYFKGKAGVRGTLNGEGVLSVYNEGTYSAWGVYGEASGTYGRGIYGRGTGSSSSGVYGTSDDASGSGVYGYVSGSNGYGVYGYASGSEGRGIFGIASDNGDVTNYGGYFLARGQSGRAVYGKASGANGIGIYGEAEGVDGKAGYFQGDVMVAGTIETTGEGVKFSDGTVQNTAAVNSPLHQVPRINTWVTVDSAGDVGYASAMTLGTDGLPIISYYDRGNGNLKVAKCGDISCSSGNTISTIDSVGLFGADNSIAIAFDGLAVISYYDETESDLKVAKCTNNACSASTVTTVDSAGNVGKYSSITIGIDGRPIISYYDETQGDLKVVRCGNADCSSGNFINSVDSGGDVGKFTSIIIGTDTLPVISYKDETNDTLKVVKCGTTSCSSGHTITTLDSMAWTGGTSITIGADTLPVISYTYFNTGDYLEELRVVKCGNAACSSGNSISVVDSEGSTGFFSSITIGFDGLPVISYIAATSDYLMAVKCGNHACSEHNTISSVAYLGEIGVGTQTSMTIGMDGIPVMSYFSTSEDELRVSRCANQFCLNYWTRR